MKTTKSNSIIFLVIFKPQVDLRCQKNSTAVLTFSMAVLIQHSRAKLTKAVLNTPRMSMAVLNISTAVLNVLFFENLQFSHLKALYNS